MNRKTGASHGTAGHSNTPPLWTRSSCCLRAREKGAKTSAHSVLSNLPGPPLRVTLQKYCWFFSSMEYKGPPKKTVWKKKAAAENGICFITRVSTINMNEINNDHIVH